MQRADLLATLQPCKGTRQTDNSTDKMPHYCFLCRKHFSYGSKLKRHEQSKSHGILAARKRPCNIISPSQSPDQSVFNTANSMDCTYRFANRAEESQTSTDHGTAAGMYVNLHIRFGAKTH